MIKHCLKILLFILLPFFVNAQKSIDSLRSYILNAHEDTAKINPLLDWGNQLAIENPDTSVILFRQALLISRQNKLTRYEAKALTYLGAALALNPDKKDSAMMYLQESNSLAKQNNLFEEELIYYRGISSIYIYVWKRPDSGIVLAYQGIALADKYKLISQKIDLKFPLSNGYLQLKKPDSALAICLDAISLSKQNKFPDREKQFLDLASYIISSSQVDTARILAEKAIAWAVTMNEKRYEAFFQKGMALTYRYAGNYPEALKAFMGVAEMYKNMGDEHSESVIFREIGNIYLKQDEYRQAISFFLMEAEIQKKLQDPEIKFCYSGIGKNYAKLKMSDSAIYFGKRAYEEAARSGVNGADAGVLDDLGVLYFELGEDSIAMHYFQESLSKYPAWYITLPGFGDWENLSEIYVGIAKLYKKRGQVDSSFHYASLDLPISQKNKYLNDIIDASSIVSDYYKSKNKIDSAFVYMQIANNVKDSLFSQDKIKEIQKIAFDEQMRQQQDEATQTKYRNRVRSYILFGGLAIVLLIAGILFRNNKQKQKTNKKLEKMLSDLKATQSQLIQSEKMASLGELTAGIAHEIQNPLNFVNNFSEVNKEMLAEMREEIGKKNFDEVSSIAKDVEENEEKIIFHGKRADAIVKGMLQHSRSSSGVKEPTDINALADEYLRLAYHGLRAKDKSFNATMKTDFDESIGNINIIPQDIGRVILNLITNAFYAASLPSKGGFSGSDKSNDPTVWVSTKKVGDKILISVRDNGPGIPQKILDKIFQPFFTTKPTGQGTGLGLSLSYDIVKVHGGEIKIETKEGEGSKFVIELPIA